ncbi:glycosyltransferase family 2 protein [Glacieibacterium frigidum]|uniref:Glycosyltransferase family 2 protein n=1 Tax=Glacieibacterium frigidum TaxID=2593303 RepID=A0A552UHB5_9SPHN|nr:glycosyltransferase family A protein [Glacieibacterium frigidum]TRW17623.1 glycosyltransferase family 2 protein [Glacieibacterium frigidum]
MKPVQDAQVNFPMRLSVVVPHRGDPVQLTECVAALASQQAEFDEIIVVANGSADNAAAIRAHAAAICTSAIVLHEPKIGAGPARNAGVAASSGDWLAFIDSDCLAAPDWIAAGRRALSTRAVFGGAIVITPAVAGQPTAIEAFDMEFGVDAARFLKRSRHLLTANLFCTRAAFDLIGAFETGVPEDKDWSYRALARGIPLASAADVVVEHPALISWPQLRYRWRRMTAEEFEFHRGRPLGALAFWLRSWLVLASIAPHAVRMLRSKRARPVPPGSVLVLGRSRFDRFVFAQKLVIKCLLQPGHEARATS